MNKDIFLTNSYGGKKEKFQPIDENNIKMYVCGPTVYDDPHIGNARPLVVFDLLFKVLKCKYGNDKVTYVRNITDIDDKIIQSSISVIFLTYVTLSFPYLHFRTLKSKSNTTNGLALPICGSS